MPLTANLHICIVRCARVAYRFDYRQLVMDPKWGARFVLGELLDSDRIIFVSIRRAEFVGHSLLLVPHC